MSEITIKNQGPVDHLSIPINPEGGVTVLRAHNGAGKSQVLEGVRVCLRRAGPLNRKRDAEGPAEVSVGGATARSGTRTSHTGELQVESIEDRLSIAELVDPQIANPVAADAKRVKAILSITSAKADFHIFEKLLPAGGMVAATQKRTRELGDLIEMAGEVKRDLQEAARVAEGEANKARGQVQALRQAVEGIDIEAEADEQVLRQRHMLAIENRAKVTAEMNAAKKTAESRSAAEKALDDAIDNYDGPSSDDAKREAEAVAKAANELAITAQEAQRAYEVALKALNETLELQKKKNDVLRAAQSHEKTIASCRQAMALDVPAGPNAVELEAAEREELAAAKAVQEGVRIRDARLKGRQLADAADVVNGQQAKAEQLRAAVGQVDAILSAAVAIPGLTVKEGRLWSDEHKDFMGNLSEGQRIRIAMSIVLPIVGEGGLVPMPQAFWQDLDPENKKLVHAEAKKRRVTVLTAEVADGPLRAEEYQP